MQCLYCETELKPLRGLFDEDFCCKDHREKYFASFRKGIGLLPALDLPPIVQKETTAETTLDAAAEERLELAAVEEAAVEAEPIEQAAVEFAIEEPAPVAAVEMVAEALEEVLPPVSAPEPALAVAEETPEEEPVCETPARVLEIVPAPVPALAAKTADHSIVSASVEGELDDSSENTAAAPPAADFLHLEVAPFGAADCYFMIDENSFPACDGPAIPDVEVFCDAMFDPEERLANLLDPAELVAAGTVSFEAGRTGETEPMAQSSASLSRPSFRAQHTDSSSWPALQVAEVIEQTEIHVAGHISVAKAKSEAGEAMALPRVPLELLALQAPGTYEAQPAMAEQAQLAVEWQQLESAPLAFSNLAPAPEIHTPVFQVSAVAMELDEDLKRAIEPPKTEAVRMAEPEIARPAAMSAAPVSRAVSAATFQPSAPAASARPEPQLNVPAMSSKTDPEPRLASEALPDIAPAGEQPLAGRTPEPVQPAIENSARIKNWRLKITFAKPA